MPERLDLTPLQEHIGTKPRTKLGQVRQAWPEIQQLRDGDHKVKDIWRLVRECGIAIGYGHFAYCVRQLAQGAAPGRATPRRPATVPATADPLQGIRDRRPKPFFNPDPAERLK